MEIEMLEEKCYSFKVGDVQIDGMRAVSTWNGMTELVGADKQKLIVSFEGGLAPMFTGLLGNKATVKASIVSGSPDLIARLKVAAEPKEPATGGPVECKQYIVMGSDQALGKSAAEIATKVRAAARANKRNP